MVINDQMHIIKIKMKSVFIIGPSGSGKSTLSQYLSEIYKSLFGPHSTILVNLDPANPSDSSSPYDIDLNHLITIEDIMEEFQLGPNGAMLYAMDFLFQNKNWLDESISKQLEAKQPHYKIAKQVKSKQQSSLFQTSPQLSSPFTIIFDLPGQVELYLQNDSTKNLIQHLQKTFIENTCILQLFDSTYIYQVNDFLSLCMMSLVTMINLQMPHINLLNKIDVIKGERPALGVLNEYCDFYSIKAVVDDLTFVDDSNKNSIAVLNSLSEVVDQYNQVSFLPCSVFKIDLIKYLMMQIQMTFNTHETNKLISPKYHEFISSVDKSYAKQEIITELENDLFKDQEEQIQQSNQEIQKFLAQIKAQIDKTTSSKPKKPLI